MNISKIDKKNSIIQHICDEIQQCKNRNETQEKIQLFSKTLFARKDAPAILDILKELKLKQVTNYSDAKDIFVKIFSKDTYSACHCPSFIYRNTISLEIVEPEDLIEHGFGMQVYKDFTPCLHLQKSSNKSLDLRERVKIELLDHDALHFLEALEEFSDPEMVISYCKMILPLMKDVPLLAELLIPFKEAKNLKIEQMVEIYKEMLLIDENLILRILKTKFLELGFIDILKKGIQELSFNKFFSACQKIAQLHPQIAARLTKYLLCNPENKNRSICLIFPPEEQMKLFQMLKQHAGRSVDIIFAESIENIFCLFTKTDLQNFKFFLNKSKFICALGPQSTKAFFEYTLSKSVLPFRQDFDKLILFYKVLVQSGGSSLKKCFMKVYGRLNFYLIFSEETIDSKSQMVLHEPFLKKVRLLCETDANLVDAFTAWLCNLGKKHFGLEKETRLSLCEMLLTSGTKETLCFLMQKSDRLGFQKDILDSEESELLSLNKQASLNIQKALFMLSSKKKIEKEGLNSRKELRDWLDKVREWCLFPMETQIEANKTLEEEKLLSMELRRYLSLIFEYQEPEYRTLLLDLFFTTNKLFFSPSNRKSPKAQQVEEFSRLLLSSCIENGLKEENAEIIFQNISKNAFLFKDTQKLSSLLDFIKILNKKPSEKNLSAAINAFLKALSSKQTAISDIKVINSFFILFGHDHFFEILNEYNKDRNFDNIFSKFFIKQFSLSFIENISALYGETFAKFRDPKALFLYAASLRGLKKKSDFKLAQQALKTYVEAVLTGNFPQIRFQQGHNLHLDFILKECPHLSPLWKESDSLKDFKLKGEENTIFQIGLSQDRENLVLCGTEVPKSCLKVYDDPYYNKALGGYAIGDILLIVINIKGHPQIEARSVIRVLWCKKKKQPVLLIEKIYKNNKYKGLEDQIKEKAISIAQKYKLPLLTKHVNFEETIPYEGDVYFLGGLNAFTYSDAAGEQYEGVFDARKEFAFKNLSEVIF